MSNTTSSTERESMLAMEGLQEVQVLAVPSELESTPAQGAEFWWKPL